MLDFIEDFTNRFPKHVDEYTLLTDNRIWKQRLVGIGVVRRSAHCSQIYRPDAPRLGVDGIWRKQPYAVYDKLEFAIPIGKNGDCYDRYLVRVAEMRQSNSIIKQCITWLRANPGPVMTDDHAVAPPSRIDMKTGLEDLIHHFKLFTEGFHVRRARFTPRSNIRKVSSASI